MHYQLCISEIKKIYSKLKELLTFHNIHHLKTDTSSVYISRNNDGKGFNFKNNHNQYEAKYLEATYDWMLKRVNCHEKCKKDTIYKEKKLICIRVREIIESTQLINANYMANMQSERLSCR